MASKTGSFDALFDDHYPLVYRTALGILGNPADAEDAAQETFLAVHRGLGAFRDECAVSTWIYRIAVRCAGRQAARRRTSAPMLEMQATDDRLPLALLQALQRIPLAFRTIILLTRVEGLSHAEVAEALGIPEGTVASRLHKARQLLLEQLM